MWDGWVDVENLCVYIFGYWNYVVGVKKNIIVVFSVDVVELFFNGCFLGCGEQSVCFLFMFCDVVWELGKLIVVGYVVDGFWVCDVLYEMVGEFVVVKFMLYVGFVGLCVDGVDVVLV